MPAWQNNAIIIIIIIIIKFNIHIQPLGYDRPVFWVQVYGMIILVCRLEIKSDNRLKS
jgi:hypothetical protein